MKNIKIFLALFVWIVAFALLYGAFWSRFPSAFPAPPQAFNEWIASHFLSSFQEEEAVDLLLFGYSIFVSIGITLIGLVGIKFMRRR